jgi:uncharacterized protein HemY
VLLTLRGHLVPATRQYEKARAAEPRVAADPKLARRLGELYLQLAQPAKAAPLLRIAGADDPEQANVAASEGRALLQLGEKRRGERRARAGRPRQPVHPDAALRPRPPRRRRAGARPGAGAVPRMT